MPITGAPLPHVTDGPYTTERVEVRPGVFIKMSEADKAAWQARQPAPAERATPEVPETTVMPKPKPSGKRY